jgi:hypothetical protein
MIYATNKVRSTLLIRILKVLQTFNIVFLIKK